MADSFDFIRKRIREDVSKGSKVRVRFPPEPNGYLHVGHAKAICLNFEIAKEFEGECNLRLDDTNPLKESEEKVAAIIEDVYALGYQPDRIVYASDYFSKFYELAKKLILSGDAYVDHSTPEEISARRGTATSPGVDSPYRNRTPDENLAFFRDMKEGKMGENECVLRAKIDMASPNFNMRDPVLYRVRYMAHHRTGKKWCIFPMYDFAHPVSDALEGITHSLCTLEFEHHRPLYEWVIEKCGFENKPQQIEFARLNLAHTVLSKRKLGKLVDDGVVDGWSDPRMPTLRGLRARGIPPEAIRQFCREIGVAKHNSLHDPALFDHCVREYLNKHSLRRIAVLDPVRLTLENMGADEIRWVDALNNPEDPEAGTRKIPLCKHLFIDREDFMEDPPKKFFRLSPGKEVRLRYACYVTCKEVVKDSSGNITEIICTYDPESIGGSTPDGRKVKGTIHWLSVEHSRKAHFGLYDLLFKDEEPTEESEVNPDSFRVIEGYVEEAASSQDRFPFQFERKGYFGRVGSDEAGVLYFNQTIPLKDSWAKIAKKAVL